MSQKTRPVVKIQGVNIAYVFSEAESFPNSIAFFEKINNLTISGKTIQMYISDDATKAKIPFLVDGKIVSGFSFPTRENVFVIEVYIAPEIQADTDKFAYEVARNYLSSLLYASEYQKYLVSPGYQPDYNMAQDLTMDIVMESSESRSYPVVIKTQ